jgi:cell division protein FtsW
MAKRVGVDKWMFCVTLLLVLFGLAMVFSSSAVMAKERFGSPYTFVLRQAGYAVFGLLSMVVLMKVDYRRYNKPNVVFPAVAITVLCLLGAFVMRDSHATHRWIKFGIFSFQPSEIAKPTLVLFLAWFLQDRMQQIDDWRNTLLPAALPSLLFIVLILKEPDLGTALVCAVVTAMMLYLAGMEKKYFAYAAVAAAPVLYWMLFRVPWRRARMLAFLNPWKDPQGSGFHTIQSLIAVGTGGLHGLGYMEGRQKLFYRW